MKERDEPPPTRHLIGLRETKSNLDVIQVDVTRPRLVNLTLIVSRVKLVRARVMYGRQLECAFAAARAMCWRHHQVLGESGAVSVPPALARRVIVILQ